MPKHGDVEFAPLTPEQLRQVEKLEKKLGVMVLAYLTPLEPAPLTVKQVAELQKVEQAMPGVSLVAYRPVATR